jgi:signal transduction histidine kinase
MMGTMRGIALSLSRLLGEGQVVSVMGAQRLMLVNIVLVLVLVGFFMVVVLALVRHSTRERVEAARLAAMGTATGRILHQVKNPLQTIILHAEMLEDSSLVSDDESRRELCEAIVGEAARMADLLGGLSTFASGVGQQLAAETLALHEVVHAAARQASREYEAAGVQVRIGPVDEIMTLGDGVFLLRALANVIHNSFEAFRDWVGTEEPGIELALRRRGAGAVIEVRDNGAGIAETELAGIFEPFVTRKGAGLGLGLPMTREIVEGHGGRVEVRSRPGQGTSVLLILPIRAVTVPSGQPA